MPDDTSLIDRLRASLDARPEILDAYVFGSRARGDARDDSDLDVAVYLDAAPTDPPSPLYAPELAADLMSELAGPSVDVVLLNTAPPVLYYHVLRDGIRLVSRDLCATTTREGYAYSRYCDYLPQLEKIEAAHSARIKSGSFGR